MNIALRVSISLSILLAGVPAFSQSESASVASELRGIRAALEQIVVLQAAQQRHAEVDILLQRIALRERRLQPLHARLAATDKEIDAIRDSLKSLEGMLEQHDELLEQEIKDGVDQPRSDTRRMLDDIRRTLAGQTERLDDLVARGRALQDELAESAEEIEILDEQLAQR